MKTIDTSLLINRKKRIRKEEKSQRRKAPVNGRRIIGTLYSIKEATLSIYEAERLLFLPRIVRELKEVHFNEQIIEIVSECCELEDILELIPNKFISNLDYLIEKSVLTMKQLSKSTETEFWVKLAKTK